MSEGKKWPWEVINLYDILAEEEAPEAVSAASESSSGASHEDELAAAGVTGFAPIFYAGIRFGKLTHVRFGLRTAAPHRKLDNITLVLRRNLKSCLTASADL